MPARTTSIADALPKIFDQVQTTTANHQKNVVALHKIHVEAAAFTEPIHGGRSIKLTGERLFEDTFIELLCRVIVLKKGVSQADRVVKFVGAYILFINIKAKETQTEGDEDDDDDDTTSARFIARLLKFLLKGFVAKDKVVRYRCVQVLMAMVAHLGEIDEDVYLILRTALIERIHDRETLIRVQAAVALSKLCGSEDPSDVEADEPTAIDVLLDTLSHDPAAEVRRATLLNIPLASHTLPALLARSRDTDTVMRRLVYSAILEKNCTSEDGSAMGPLHPRVLTIAQRELIIRNGLGDREPAVRAAAGSLLGAWVDVVRGSTKAEDGGGVIDDVLALLELFDLSENTVAEDALLSIFATRIDIFDQLEFKDDFWATLTPERAFLARVCVEHCIATNDQTKLEVSLPVVTHLAYQIQNIYNKYQEDLDGAAQERAMRNLDADETSDRDADECLDDLLLDAVFVIGEMLKLAVNLDYADEIGRRKMFQLVRDMISQDNLPEALVARCLDVLRVLSPNERDLIRVVVEVVHELRDDSEGEDGEKEKEVGGEGEDGNEDDVSPSTSTVGVRKTPKAPKELNREEQARVNALDLRCLSLCIGMLERVNGTFEENSTLEGILGELIIPAVKSKELALREKGLVCLGLCCLIARRMALNSFQLFVTQVQSSPEVLKMRVLQVIFDVLMVHEEDFLGRGAVAGEKVIEFLIHILNGEESEKVQALLCIGLSKLALAGMVSDDRVLKSLVVAYLSPDTVQNQELRQCLAYFFPVYCYSSSANQQRMRQIAVTIFQQLAVATRELDDDQDMVSPAQIIGMFVDWTDPQKAIEVPGQTIDDGIHLDFAEDILRALLKDEWEKEDKKVLCQVLPRLHLPETVDDDQIRTAKLLVHNVFIRRPVRDVSARNALSKFDAAISKKYAEKLSDFSEEEYRQLKQLDELFKFLDDIIPLEDGEEIEMPKTRGRKRGRRSESVMTETTATSAAEDTSVGSGMSDAKGKGRAKESKRRRVNGSDEDEDDELPEGHETPAPSRSLPKRAASTKKKIPVQHIPDEEEDEDEDEATTPPAKRKGARRARAPEPESSLSGANMTFDSIMDSEEEEEEEVLSLVV